MPPVDASVLAALDILEDAEAKRVMWGLLDESWTEDEVLHLLSQGWEGGDAATCLQDLLRAELLLELPQAWPRRYRTRMAETLRLFGHLRQLFPERPWQEAPRLVADFRFLHQPRYFPIRAIDQSELARLLESHGIDAKYVSSCLRVVGLRVLSSFQYRATTAVLDAIGRQEDNGVVVGAGTGSGKTLAFYLPALAHLDQQGVSGSRVIAVYPRNELLKDQLATALVECRRLRASGGRQLTIAAYFGPTPTSSEYEPLERDGWRPTSSGWICPFLRCPASAQGESTICGGDLLWRRAKKGSKPDPEELLYCTKCGEAVGGDELLLTRRAIQASPPDILFTTTEMLNRSLSDGWSMHVFGVGARTKRKPAMVLLDEIHTYEGTSGAQVAFLLRRWRHLLGRPVQWVGLSATLANAPAFFSALCGVPEERIVDVRPDPHDMTARGREYQLLLRGDPSSQSALLSTSIQSLMLLRRVLDGSADQSGAYGTRVFAFCDNLDLVNRLYRQILDAEARDPFGKPVPGQAILAGLRIPGYAEQFGVGGDWSDRDSEGQHWWLASRLGTDTRSLQVTRVSSQDAGVSSSSDVVVATASLEVGYDDPNVGAVLQHKAPRDTAQFMQRRGRAGRTQSQRPWTVVVLSDYGRDRIAYQQYETILDPALTGKTLPLGNQSVRKMQGAMCLMDWAAARLKVDQYPFGSLRKAWTGPGAESDLQSRSRDLLAQALEAGPVREDLLTFMQLSMRLSRDEVLSLGWEQPRSVWLDALPTMLRRLTSGWSSVREGVVYPASDTITRDPMPEFIPRTLFSDLALPEVLIDPPADYDDSAHTSIPISLALNELCPGGVTLRWAVKSVKGLWIAPPAVGTDLALEESLAASGHVLRTVPGRDQFVPLIRPTTIRPVRPEAGVLATSNGRLTWSLLAELDRSFTEVPRPRNSRLGSFLLDSRAYLHVDRGPLHIWRYATSAKADVAKRTGRERSEFGFTWRGEPAAVGFDLTVDAIAFTVQAPTSLEGFALHKDPSRLRHLRSQHFKVQMRQALLELDVNPFAADWLIEATLVLAAQEIARSGTLSPLADIADADWPERIGTVADIVFLALTRSDEEEQPLRDTLTELCGDARVIALLRAQVPLLQADPNGDWLPWLQSIFHQTVAAALQVAAQGLCPDFDVDADSVIDVVALADGQASLVLSDSISGGGGLVETLTSRIAEDPRRFDRLAVSALSPSDLEEVDSSLRRTLHLLETDDKIRVTAANFRSTDGDRLSAWQLLLDSLREGGVSRGHATAAALANRLFRPGSTTATDSFIRQALKRWGDLDEGARFAIDYRSACAILSEDPSVIAQSPLANGSGQKQLSLTLLAVLWPREGALRPLGLRAINRYVDSQPETERTLVLEAVRGGRNLIDVDEFGWVESTAHALGLDGSAFIYSSSDSKPSLSACLRQIATRPFEIDWLRVYAKVEGVAKSEGRLIVELSLEEAPQ